MSNTSWERPKPVPFLGNYIDGQFTVPSKPDYIYSKISPADLSDHLSESEILSCKSHVDEAVLAAKRAFDFWSGLEFQKRADLLMKLKSLYQIHKEDIAQLISREMGKPLWESQTEAQGMISKIDITLNYSMDLVKKQFVEGMPLNIKGVTSYKPRGVMAVVGPYNFPGHLPNGSIIPALAMGNTVIFKPSEYTPLTGQLMAQLFSQAGFPKGVFNLIQGNGEIAEKLVKHSDVDGVLFTGSYETGLKIKKATIEDYWKILALEMGGKNVSIVWKDALLDKAVYECIVGAFSTTGQRCSCTSRILVHKEISEVFIEKFLKIAKNISIGHWNDNVFMGPLTSREAQEKYFYFLKDAKKEKAEVLLDAKKLSEEYFDYQFSGYYVSPSVFLVKPSKTSTYQNSEIFGPNVAISIVDNIDEALSINNSTGYGLVASIFTQDEALYKKTCQKAKVGILNWNRSTIGANSKLPFGGLGRSGNDRPSGYFAIYYCSTPLASLQDQNVFHKDKVLPGINY